MKKYGTPEIFNTDQGSQFTSEEFVSVLLSHGIQISMDGRGRAFDNIFTERFWRTIKYEWLFLKSFESINELRRSFEEYSNFYNFKRLHQALGYKTPEEVYSNKKVKSA